MNPKNIGNRYFRSKALEIEIFCDNFIRCPAKNTVIFLPCLDDFLNKREIGAQAPSRYMRRFAKVNPRLSETMKSHLVSDLEKFGVWGDDYQAFIERRARVVSRDLQKRIIKQDIDKEAQPELSDDYDESSKELVELV